MAILRKEEKLSPEVLDYFRMPNGNLSYFTNVDTQIIWYFIGIPIYSYKETQIWEGIPKRQVSVNKIGF